VSRSFRPLVLCYHAVSDRWPHLLAVPAETIERQVRSLLRRGFRPATARETLEGRGRLLHVTFDDAFRSVNRALPALERLGVPATVFASTAYAAEGASFDVPELAAEAAAFPDELATMAWDELRELVERGVEVGSHTRSHPHLTRCSDHELERELRGAREELESQLRRPCTLIAYPYGEHDGRVRAAARAAGYEAAFALPGRVSPLDPFALPRVGIYRRDSMLRATLKTSALVRRPVAALRRAG
jgi:peptidoglycan/xylan/chitin deacetylase (PgdA/CDA1 family)